MNVLADMSAERAMDLGGRRLCQSNASAATRIYVGVHAYFGRVTAKSLKRHHLTKKFGDITPIRYNRERQEKEFANQNHLSGTVGQCQVTTLSKNGICVKSFVTVR